MLDYLISARKLRRGNFSAEPGPTRFLKSPDDEVPVPTHAIRRKRWVEEVMASAHTHQDPSTGENCGDHYKAKYEGDSGNGHSWYFRDEIFIADLAQTLAGDLDSRVVGVRRSDSSGDLHLL